jgi:ribosomal protein L28
MARACAICGKTAIGIFNPQSSGMNRVRAHRRSQPNLQSRVVEIDNKAVRALVCTRCSRTLAKSSR